MGMEGDLKGWVMHSGEIFWRDRLLLEEMIGRKLTVGSTSEQEAGIERLSGKDQGSFL